MHSRDCGTHRRRLRRANVSGWRLLRGAWRVNVSREQVETVHLSNASLAA
jgi:hypothetical protein